MKILTISASPYLLTHLGRLNSDIIQRLRGNYEVASAVWDYDPQWFPAEEDGKFYFKKGEEKICEIFPFINNIQKYASPQLYEIIKKVKSDIVISLGDYNDVNAVFAIKSLDSTKFKWLHIMALDAIPIKDEYYDIFKQIDCVISTTQMAFEEISKISNLDNSKSLVGVNSEIFNFLEKKNEKLKIICCGKNSQGTGIASLMNASQYLSDCEIYFHTNLFDRGDYDLNLLKKRYDKNNVVNFPEQYIGINDGLTNEEMKEMYNNFDIFIDVSVRSSTGMCLLEAMACGCIPIVTKIGAIKEIVELLPKEYQFFAEGNLYIGNLEEEYRVVSVNSIVEKIEEIRKIKKDEGKFNKMRETISGVAKSIEGKNFLNLVEEKIKILQNKEKRLNVENI